jgi:hypothetical protein
MRRPLGSAGDGRERAPPIWESLATQRHATSGASINTATPEPANAVTTWHDHDYGGGHHHSHDEHGHSHGLVDRSIVRSRDGVRTVAISLGVLGVAAGAQLVVFLLSGSVALLADLIHNFGDALTAVPLGIAFFLRSFRGEKIAGLFVVLAIFVSACVALYETILRFIHPQHLTHLWVLAAAGGIGLLSGEVVASEPRGDRGEETGVEAGRLREAREEARRQYERRVGGRQHDPGEVVSGLQRLEPLDAELGRHVAVVATEHPERRDRELAE